MDKNVWSLGLYKNISALKGLIISPLFLFTFHPLADVARCSDSTLQVGETCSYLFKLKQKIIANRDILFQ